MEKAREYTEEEILTLTAHIEQAGLRWEGASLVKKRPSEFKSLVERTFSDAVKHILFGPIEEVPLYIHETPWTKICAIWRMSISR